MTPEYDEARAAMSGRTVEDVRHERHLRLTTACPWCKARPGQPCRIRHTSGSLRDTPLQGRTAHPSREDIA